MLAVAQRRESPSRSTGFGGGLLANRSVGLSASRPRWATAQLRRLGLNLPWGRRSDAKRMPSTWRISRRGKALRYGAALITPQS